MKAEACAEWVICMAIAFPASALVTACVNVVSPFPIPQSQTFILCVFCVTWLVVFKKRPATVVSKHVHEEKKPSALVAKCVHQDVPEVRKEVSETKEEIDKIEELLQVSGTLIETTATICLPVLRQIYKDQKDHLRQYHNFRKQYADQFGFVVNILEGHRKDIVEASRAATETNVSLCNIIGQYRQTIDENQNAVRQHLKSTGDVLKRQEDLIASNRVRADARCISIEDAVNTHAQLIEQNKRLIQEHGTSIDNVVSDHSELVTEYQAALEGLASLTAANRLFSLIHKPSGWETLGDSSQEIDDNGLEACAQTQLAREKLINGPGLGVAPASMVETVHELSRTFRQTYNARIKAVHGKPEGTGQEGSLSSRNNDAIPGKHHPSWGTDSGMDQIMVAIYSQLQDTVQAAVKAQHVEGIEQIQKAQEDIEKLRAGLAEIQEHRHWIRTFQEFENQNKRLLQIRDIRKHDRQRFDQDEAMRAEFAKLLEEADDRYFGPGSVTRKQTPPPQP